MGTIRSSLKESLLKMKIPLALSAILTILYYSLSILMSGIEIYLMPIFFVVFMVSLAGVITIPVFINKISKKTKIKPFLLWLVGVALGFYIALLIQIPINSWDQKMMNLNGIYLSKNIDNYFLKEGHYPDSLSLINIKNDSIVGVYKIDRFEYNRMDSSYLLFVPVPIMDRWEWNNNKKEFVFVGF